MMLRPIRPKPLIPTLMGILPSSSRWGCVFSGRPQKQTSATLQNLKCYGLRQQKSTHVETEKLLRVLSDAGNAVTHEADENRFRRGLAINPVLYLIPVRIALANFV